MITIPEGTEIANTYRVEARLGSGAFGTVYRVKHRYLGTLALKFLPADADAVERMAAEGARHAHLFHPNITRVFDVNVTEVSGETFVYIASEYMPSGDLDTYFESTQRLPVHEWRILVEDILSALDHAHTQTRPVFHRDIKPANVLIGGTSTPTFKLGDFGVSTETWQNRPTASAHGTVAYQAPECALGSYVVESDLYGAAVVIYRALVGTYPFSLTGTSEDILRCKQDPQPPSKFRLECPVELDDVLLRALSPDPFSRYHSAAELRQALLKAGPLHR